MRVCITRDGARGELVLNRPEALHAIDIEMVRALAAGLAQHQQDDAVKQVLITSSGGKAFCAGGDVRAVATIGKTDPAAAAEFFRAEYALNHAIATSAKPVIALVDGLAMGGGLGLSVHARHCLVTGHALMAMPEMTIGLFPDVGAGVFLNRLSAAVGKFIALTGARLSAGDCLYAQLASGYLDAAHTDRLLDELRQGREMTLDAPLPSEQIAPHRAMIEDAFAPDTLPEIVARLEAQASDWSRAQLEILDAGCPTSQQITLEHLRQSRGQALDLVLKREFRMASACLGGKDFFEGVRAQLIDKDKRPCWQSPEPQSIAAHFAAPRWPELEIS